MHEALGHELLVGALDPIDLAGVVADVSLGHEVVALDEAVGGQLCFTAELDQVVEGGLELAEATFVETLEVVDADADVEPRLAFVELSPS